MRIAIVGSRSFKDYELMKSVLNHFFISVSSDTIVSGGAKGADSLAERYAEENGIRTMIIKPDWDKHGKKAGMLRNIEIAENSDICFAFWDGESKGTAHTIELFRKADKTVELIVSKN